MNYKELLDLGFKRNDCLANDTVWFDQYGYKCFWLEITLQKYKKYSIEIQWEPTKGKFELIVCIGNDVISSKQITKKQMITLVKTFKQK